jgi:predicted nicotinamide N-methyase
LNVHDDKNRIANRCALQIRGKSVLELGAGCGLVGIAACVLGAERVILTDLPYTMELMRTNVAKNDASGTAECRLCDWLKPPEFDESWRSNVLLVADCVWVEELIAPLLTTISRFLESSDGHVKVIVSYQRRGKSGHDLFWAGMSKMFDIVETIELLMNKPEHLGIYECTINCGSGID